MAAFAPGEHVLTPLGKGVVLEVRNRRLLVRVQSRDVLLDARDIKPATAPSTPPGTSAAGKRSAHRRTGRALTFSEGMAAPGKDPARRVASARVLDVHGKTVEQALEAVDDALSEALLGDATELRVIHGRSSGRIRDALQRHLRTLPVIRKARLDPDNAGVTIIAL